MKTVATTFAVLVGSLMLASGAFAAASTDYKTAPAGTYEIDPHHASVHWSVSHMGFSNYTARFDEIAGSLTFDPAKPEASSVQVGIKTDSADTGFDKMNDELEGEKFFNVKKFPTATFTSTKLTLLSATTGKLDGNLTLLGVTKPVSFDVTFNGTGNNFGGQPTMGFSATGSIKRSDFGMKEYLGVVGDDVALKIEAEFNKKQ